MKVQSKNPQMREVLGSARKVAQSNLNVVLLGQTGTGKEVLARAIHNMSDRADGPFVAVNCGAIPEGLQESELFGHMRGAFTGAVRKRVGMFSEANGGTIFLDEIGEVSLALQVKLLRVIETGGFRPVGGEKEELVDSRIIAATNRDLASLVEMGRFREDLFYRLSVATLTLPPLRERTEDIPDLVDYFIGESNQSHSRQVSGMSQEALDVLGQYSWPGNIRQLRNVVEKMVVFAESAELGMNDLPDEVNRPSNVILAKQTAWLDRAFPEDGVNLEELVEDFRTALIEKAMERTGGNVTRAARLLRVNSRTLFRRKADLKLKADDTTPKN